QGEALADHPRLGDQPTVVWRHASSATYWGRSHEKVREADLDRRGVGSEAVPNLAEEAGSRVKADLANALLQDLQEPAHVRPLLVVAHTSREGEAGDRLLLTLLTIAHEHRQSDATYPCPLDRQASRVGPALDVLHQSLSLGSTSSTA